jgi:hypothetical protein
MKQAANNKPINNILMNSSPTNRYVSIDSYGTNGDQLQKIRDITQKNRYDGSHANQHKNQCSIHGMEE